MSRDKDRQLQSKTLDSIRHDKGADRSAVPAEVGMVARPVVLVSSPRVERGSKGATAREALEAAGLILAEELPVSDFDRHLPMGSAWRERGYAAAVAAGGDGTIGAVATQVAGSGLPLGILPLGTSNDTARSLGIPLDLGKAAAVIARGVWTPIDAGQA